MVKSIEPSKYWQIVRVKSSGEIRVDEISDAKAFFIKNLSPRLEANPTISHRDIQRTLLNRSNCDDLTHSKAAKKCLRCYVSNELTMICQKFVKRFSPQKAHYNSHRDSQKTPELLALDQELKIVDPLRNQSHYYLTEDALYPWVLDSISHLEKDLVRSEQYHLGLIDKILDTFDPEKGSLSTWTSRLFKQDKNVKQVLLEHGIELVTNWSLLNETKSAKLRQILVDHTYSDQETEGLINLLETFQLIYQRQVLSHHQQGRPYPDPTPEQLIQISAHIKTSEPLEAEAVKKRLNELAQIIRATRVDRSQPAQTSISEYSATDELTIELQKSQCLEKAVTKVLTARIDSLSNGSAKKKQQAEDLKRILELFFCKQKSTVEIANQLGIGHQATISRKLGRSKLQEDISIHLLHCWSHCLFAKLELHLNPDRLKAWNTKIKAFLEPEIDALMEEADRQAQTSKNRCLDDPLSVAICQYITQQQH